MTQRGGKDHFIVSNDALDQLAALDPTVGSVVVLTPKEAVPPVQPFLSPEESAINTDAEKSKRHVAPQVSEVERG